MLYRYEFIPKDDSSNKCGILTVLDDIINDIDEIWRLPGLAFIEGELPAPECDMHNTISYFTEKGNRKFRKSLRALCRAIDETGKGSTMRVEIDSIDPNDILYTDPYQIVIHRKDD